MSSTQLDSVKQQDNKGPCINPAAPLICCGCSICWQHCFGPRQHYWADAQLPWEAAKGAASSTDAELRPFRSQARAATPRELKLKKKKVYWTPGWVRRGRRGWCGIHLHFKTFTTNCGWRWKPPEWARGWMGVNWNEKAVLLQLPALHQEADVSYLSWRHESCGCSNTMRRTKWQCFSLLRAKGIAPFPILIAADSVFPTDVRYFLYLHRSIWD